jgi:dihydroorotate dehydrogenase (fumarate)
METRTSYLGLRLEHPFIAGASPLSYHLDTIRQLEDAGAAAIVMHSLFEEQITFARSGYIDNVDALERDDTGILAAFPPAGDYCYGPDDYAEHVFRTKQAVAIPVIGSLNGRTGESWLRFARVIEQAGADALELNRYEVPADLSTPGTTTESQLVNVVRELKRLIAIPIAVKLSPFFTSFGNVARQLDAAGADGLVLFNRFYQPDIDIRTMELATQAELSTSGELPLRLRWTAILYGRIRPSIAISGGVAVPNDGIKAMLAGADVVQLVSALLRHGPNHIAAMRQALERWLQWNHMETLAEARGAVSLKKTSDAAAFERGQYIRMLHSWTDAHLPAR